MWAQHTHIGRYTYSHEAFLVNEALNKYIPVVFFFLKGQCWGSKCLQVAVQGRKTGNLIMIQAAQIPVLCAKLKPLHTGSLSLSRPPPFLISLRTLSELS